MRYRQTVFRTKMPRRVASKVNSLPTAVVDLLRHTGCPQSHISSRMQ